ncbi:hypothetical protein WDW37_07415 [Bdellovibrionota bacterium FG-1]
MSKDKGGSSVPSIFLSGGKCDDMYSVDIKLTFHPKNPWPVERIFRRHGFPGKRHEVFCGKDYSSFCEYCELIEFRKGSFPLDLWTVQTKVVGMFYGFLCSDDYLYKGNSLPIGSLCNWKMTAHDLRQVTNLTYNPAMNAALLSPKGAAIRLTMNPKANFKSGHQRCNIEVASKVQEEPFIFPEGVPTLDEVGYPTSGPTNGQLEEYNKAVDTFRGMVDGTIPPSRRRTWTW